MFSCFNDCYDFEGNPERNPYYQRFDITPDQPDWKEPSHNGRTADYPCPNIIPLHCQYQLKHDIGKNEPSPVCEIPNLRSDNDGLSPAASSPGLVGETPAANLSPDIISENPTTSLPPGIVSDNALLNLSPGIVSGNLPANLSPSSFGETTQGSDANIFNSGASYQADKIYNPQGTVASNNGITIDENFGLPQWGTDFLRKRKERARGFPR